MLTVDFDRLRVGRRTRFIDVGAGAGRHSYEALRRGADVTAFDMDEVELKAVDDMFGAMDEVGEVPPGGSGQVTVGTILDMPYDDGSFALGSLAAARRFADHWGLRLWATEWGYHPGQPDSWWTAGLRLLASSVGVTVIYDTPAGPNGGWDTFMRPAAYRRVAAFMGAAGT